MNETVKTPQVLIVDDIPKNLQLLGQVLSKEGYKIIIASNGIQALKVTEKVIPDLILLDIMMPGMDGFEICYRLKKSKQTSEIPIIFLTAKTEPEDIVKGFQAGAVDYVTKPFNTLELIQRVKTHLDLRDKTIRLNESNRNIQELVHVLTHDLSNPISAIHTTLQIVHEDPEIFLKMKNMMQLAIGNCLSIIDNVKKMSSIDDGKLQLVSEVVNLENLLQRSLIIFSQKLNDKQLKVDLNVAKETTVYVEPRSFGNSVFNNILSNAIKFSHPESTIEVSSETRGDLVELRISDHGVGIPEELLNDVFNVNKATSRKGTKGEIGTGYGMPLVKKFVTKFNGKIEIESEEGKGTTIILLLPANSK
ncbi:MAG: hybrid sensor histidine kinase/response regulator [Leptospiraceae bacterium]|nr:hybrid sensor histidine kinase/response regulator [Leptospiraceae bacterium]MCP5495963.1 hybrid sensor histidine kinase/response regulator [Leptospiraceae bacterium]